MREVYWGESMSYAGSRRRHHLRFRLRPRRPSCQAPGQVGCWGGLLRPRTRDPENHSTAQHLAASPPHCQAAWTLPRQAAHRLTAAFRCLVAFRHWVEFRPWPTRQASTHSDVMRKDARHWALKAWAPDDSSMENAMALNGTYLHRLHATFHRHRHRGHHPHHRDPHHREPTARCEPSEKPMPVRGAVVARVSLLVAFLG